MTNLLIGNLSQRQLLAFFLAAVAVFILPLILADNFYIDDNWRAQLGGMGWKQDGRVLTEWLHRGLAFTQGAPNLFPLPLLAASIAMSFALRSLVNHYFSAPTLASCLVVLPLWYSPFFLQNLSYQYDGPAMALGVVAVIHAITFRHASSRVVAATAAICIAVGLSFYQMVIDIYLGLCCIEIIRLAGDKNKPEAIYKAVASKVIHLLLGLTLYCMTAFQFANSDRTTLRTLEPGWTERLIADTSHAAQRVAVLYNDGNAWLCWGVLGTACAGLGLVLYRTSQLQIAIQHKLIVASLCLLASALAIAAIPGLALAFDFYNDGARLMTGLSSALVLLLYLAYQVLTAVQFRFVFSPLLLGLPVLAMLSFSFAYGRVMSLQKELATSINQSLSYTLMSDKRLKDLPNYYVLTPSTQGWLVGADGAFHFIPALRYVLNVDFLILAEMLPRSTGITNVSSLDGERTRQAMRAIEEQKAPIVDSRFYSIHVIGNDGYIVMKRPFPNDRYPMPVL